MKKIIVLFAASILLVGLTGCNTLGNQRMNGTNTSHVQNKMKHVTVYGNVHIGGKEQDTDRAAQEGLGRVKAEAKVEDTLNGQEDLLKEVVKPLPAQPEIIL